MTEGFRPKRVVLATRNAHKIEELGRMLADVGIEFVGLDDVAPGSDDLVENGDTFRANALMKAEQAATLGDMPALADDSGLEVDALDGAPGVYSARFSGTHGDTPANNALLLERLEGVPEAERTARFRCVVALVGAPGDPTEPLFFEGSCEGRIGFEPNGEGGFGYDPLFVLPDRCLTVAQLSDAEKDAISHRGEAVRELVEYLRGE